MHHCDIVACGSCRICGRKERAHRSLQNHRTVLHKLPHALSPFPFTRTQRPELLLVSTHRFCRGGTYSKPSLAIFTQCTGVRKNAGFMLPLVRSFIQIPAAAAALSSIGLVPYAPKCPMYFPLPASTITTRRLP